MANQVSEDEYRAQADRVIDNNETVEEIRTQIKLFTAPLARFLQ